MCQSGKNKELLVYQTETGAIELRADLTEETLWANLYQIARLFGRDKSVISRHIKNIFKEGELERDSTVAFFATVRQEGKRKVKRNIEHFNLDVILSVGYRVNSKKATRFRKWATQILKKHIYEGFTINFKVLLQKKEQYKYLLKNLKKLASRNTEITPVQIIDIVEEFSFIWFTLENYDKNNFQKRGWTSQVLALSASELYKEIAIFKKKLIAKGNASELFGLEKNKNTLKGILGNIFQTAFGEDIYSSLEEKAAHLLYFIVKDHPFVDGNKRIAAYSFLWFLQKQNIAITIKPETLALLTLLIAESSPKDKEKIIGLILSIMKKTLN